MLNFFFPFSNGASVFDGEKLCVCLIDESGNKVVGGRVFKKKNKALQIPFVRGFVYYFYGLYLYALSFFIGQKLTLSRRACGDSGKRRSRFSAYLLFAIFVMAAFLFAFIVLSLFPKIIIKKILNNNYDKLLNNLFISFFRIFLIYFIFLIFKFIPFMSNIYSFNTAGCKIFNKTAKKEVLLSRLCPLNFLNFLLNISILSIFVVSLIAAEISPIIDAFFNLAIYLLFISVCYEILYIQTQSKFLWIKDIAIITNILFTRETKTTHDEVFLVIKNEMKNYNDFAVADGDEISLSSVYAEMETKLRAQDRYEESDVDWIIANVLGLNRVEIKLKRFISQKEYRDIMRACERRAKGEPISNIFGFVEFYGLRFEVNKKVLSPRMETEILVEEVLKKIKENNAENVLDVCTGSGAIAISIAKNSNCSVTGSDISKQALAVAKNNAKNNNVNVDFVLSDIFKTLKKNKKYDIIVSNPPYIKSQDIEKLDKEVKDFDPKLALDGGEDGLDFYRKIIFESVGRLKKNGFLFFELGEGQYKSVKILMENAGFKDTQIVKDYNRIERVIYGRISN